MWIWKGLQDVLLLSLNFKSVSFKKFEKLNYWVPSPQSLIWPCGRCSWLDFQALFWIHFWIGFFSFTLVNGGFSRCDITVCWSQPIEEGNKSRCKAVYKVALLLYEKGEKENTDPHLLVSA